MPRLHRSTVIALLKKALSNGGTQRCWSDGKTNFMSLHWDISGNCLKPVPVEHTARVSARLGEKHVIPTKEGQTAHLTMETRCRRCENCLKKRAAQWRYRAKSETAAASRTWFGTLTFRPDEHSRLDNVTRVRLDKGGTDLETLPTHEQFEEKLREHYAEVVLYFKRLRKAGSKFRYIVVTEKHKSGLIHFHLLIHETCPDHPTRKALLQKEWRCGFSKFNLATETPQVTYLFKYLTKEAITGGVKASLHYGRPNDKAERSESVTSSTNPPKEELLYNAETGYQLISNE